MILPASILSALICIALLGGVFGQLFVAAWAFVGAWLTLNTRSRGLFADCLFALLWPIHVWLEWRE